MDIPVTYKSVNPIRNHILKTKNQPPAPPQQSPRYDNNITYGNNRRGRNLSANDGKTDSIHLPSIKNANTKQSQSISKNNLK